MRTHLRSPMHRALLIGLAASALASAACNPQQMARQGGGRQRLSIATGGTGGVYYPYGGGIAKVISESIPNVEATAEVTAASVDNLKFLRDGKSTSHHPRGHARRCVEGQAGSRTPASARLSLAAVPDYTHS